MNVRAKLAASKLAALLVVLLGLRVLVLLCAKPGGETRLNSNANEASGGINRFMFVSLLSLGRCRKAIAAFAFRAATITDATLARTCEYRQSILRNSQLIDGKAPDKFWLVAPAGVQKGRDR